MSTARYIIAVLLMISLPPTIAWWYVIHPFVGFWRRVGKPITYMVLTVFFLGSMVGLFAIRDALVLTDFGTNWILIGVATGLVIPTIWLSIARAKYLKLCHSRGSSRARSGRRGRQAAGRGDLCGHA
jgi:hypothetical protein